MESLANEYTGEVDFYVLYVREAHPGEHIPAHRSFSEKLKNANDLKREEKVGRTILVDDIEGTMNRDYGARPNSVYIIGTDGVVSYRADWNNPEEVKKHVNLLLAKNGQGGEVTPVDITGRSTRRDERNNFVRITSRLLRITNRVLWRAGFASLSDWFLMTPSLIQGRVHAWMEKDRADKQDASAQR